MGTCLSAVNTQPIAAIGKSKTMFTWTIVKRVVGILAVIMGLLTYGMWGLMAGVIFNSWFSYFVNIWQVSKYIGYKWTAQLIDLMPIAGAALGLGFASFMGVNFFNLNIFVDGIAKFVSFILLYLGWSFFFKPESFEYTKNTIIPMIGIVKKINVN